MYYHFFNITRTLDIYFGSHSVTGAVQRPSVDEGLSSESEREQSCYNVNAHSYIYIISCNDYMLKLG